MDLKAIEAARVNFMHASQSMDDLAAATVFAEIQRHWAAFLVNAGRVYTKLEQGSKTKPKSIAWWGKKWHDRKKDPLLCYIWHARNADEHTLIPITQVMPGGVTPATPTPEELARIHEALKPRMDLMPDGDLAIFDVVEPHLKLLDAIDKGVRFPVPTTHKGEAISAASPNNIGLLALAYFDQMIKEAEALV